MLSLSRCYVVPTYLVFGMAASYLNLVTAHRRPLRLLVCWDRWHITRLAAGSAALFTICVLFVKVFA